MTTMSWYGRSARSRGSTILPSAAVMDAAPKRKGGSESVATQGASGTWKPGERYSSIVSSWGFEVWDLEVGVWGLGLKGWGLGVGLSVLGIEFVVEGLEVGVEGLGFEGLGVGVHVERFGYRGLG